jgi:hypothetical protein
MYISIHVTSSQCIYALFKQKQKKMTFAAAGKKEKKNTPLTLWITQMPKNRLVNDALFVCVLKLRIIFIQCKYFTTLKKKKKNSNFCSVFFFKEKSPTIVVPHLLVLVYLHMGSYLVENSSKRM